MIIWFIAAKCQPTAKQEAYFTATSCCVYYDKI